MKGKEKKYQDVFSMLSPDGNYAQGLFEMNFRSWVDFFGLTFF